MATRRLHFRDSAVLREKAAPVKTVSDVILQLLDDMTETMYEAGGVGLAAPQVGIGKRLVVIDPGDDQLIHLINPCLEETVGETVDVEGCLSIPGVYGEVPRAEKVTVTALDRDGREIRFQAEGLPARILQHEIDHLEGILFIDRAVRLVAAEELNKPEPKTKAEPETGEAP